MRRFFAILISLLLLSSAALAEYDLSAMSTDELLALQDAIAAELAGREPAEADAQIIDVNGVRFSLDSFWVGTGRGDAPAVCIVMSAENTTDAGFTPLYDLGCDIYQDGVALETTYFDAPDFPGPSVSESSFAVIAPGAAGIKVSEAGLLISDSSAITVVLSKRHIPAGVDPYCGTFTIDLSAPQ